MRFKRILCAFDESASARAALAVATDLAPSCLLLCRVVQTERVLAAIGDIPDAARIAEETIAASDRELETERRSVATQVPSVETVTDGGASVWHSLTEEAERWAADLIVIGAGTRRHGIIGSTCERVLRHAPCAVLVVAGSFRPLARVLCAVDFSEPSRRALTIAAEIAAERGATLTLVHVVSNRDRALFAQAALLAGAPDARKAAEETLRRWAGEIDTCPASRITVIVVDGRPGEAVVDAARAGQADLIVAGSHGRTGLQRALIGSVAEEIVRGADRPVLIVH